MAQLGEGRRGQPTRPRRSGKRARARPTASTPTIVTHITDRPSERLLATDVRLANQRQQQGRQRLYRQSTYARQPPDVCIANQLMPANRPTSHLANQPQTANRRSSYDRPQTRHGLADYVLPVAYPCQSGCDKRGSGVFWALGWDLVAVMGRHYRGNG